MSHSVTILLIRHATNPNVGKGLTGWLPGVSLDDEGRSGDEAPKGHPLRYGIYELGTGTMAVQNYHASVWWGATLLLVGLFYLIRFRPSRTS